MKYRNEILTVPYRQEGEALRRAAIVFAPFSLDGLSDDEIQLLGLLSDASDRMNAIFRDQFEPKTAAIRRLVHALIPAAEGDERARLEAYATMIDLQNSPYAMMPRKNCLVGIPMDRLRELAALAGGTAPDDLAEGGILMSYGYPTPPKAGFYPHDLTDEEFQSLGEAANTVNSTVLRDAEGNPEVMLNEERYRDILEPVVERIAAARAFAKDPVFRLYLDAKIEELRTGSEEARRIADYLWIRHQSPVDFIVSTALEVYTDDWKNARGSACAAVLVRDRASGELLAKLVERVPEWERTAPWRWKKESIDLDSLPRLRFVNVLTWSGDYVTGPMITLAQSLPNDEWIVSRVGSVNMVYRNTGEAIHGIIGDEAAKRLLAAEEYRQSADLLFDASQLHSALHEIGHTTGRMDPDHEKGQPRDWFEEQFSFLEETRAELFGLWSMELLVQDGVIDERMRRASYADFVLTLVLALRFVPEQAHGIARNAIYHAFVERHAVVPERSDDGIRFGIDHERIRTAAAELLGMIGDIKSAGDKAAARTFRERYVSTDPLRDELQERTADFPLGRGVIFPRLVERDGRIVRELDYPERFTDQRKFSRF